MYFILYSCISYYMHGFHIICMDFILYSCISYYMHGFHIIYYMHSVTGITLFRQIIPILANCHFSEGILMRITRCYPCQDTRIAIVALMVFFFVQNISHTVLSTVQKRNRIRVLLDQILDVATLLRLIWHQI